ncbi:MAG: hypothetical protein RKE49_02380 [Oceanicaulis sp.]
MSLTILADYGEFIGGVLALIGVVGSVFWAQRGIKKRIDADKQIEQGRYQRQTASAYEYFYNVVQEHLTHYAVSTNLFSRVALLPTDQYNAELARQVRSYCEAAVMPDTARTIFEPDLIDSYARLSPNVRRLIASYNSYRLGIAAEMRDAYNETIEVLSGETATEAEKLEHLKAFLDTTYSGFDILVTRCRQILSELQSAHRRLEVPSLEHWDGEDARHELGKAEDIESVTKSILDHNMDALKKHFRPDTPPADDGDGNGGSDGSRPPASDNRTGGWRPFARRRRAPEPAAPSDALQDRFEQARSRWFEALRRRRTQEMRKA